MKLELQGIHKYFDTPSGPIKILENINLRVDQGGFISVILKKHPTNPTTLVNYKLLYIIIPCSLLGSTVGALGQTLIPKIGQLILLVLVFIFFAQVFIKKLR